MALTLGPGDHFPVWPATTHTGEHIDLHAPGTTTVIWFYPRDFTGG